jgi:hypothetical protein
MVHTFLAINFTSKNIYEDISYINDIYTLYAIKQLMIDKYKIKNDFF